jgi:hypothetical protein
MRIAYCYIHYYCTLSVAGMTRLRVRQSRNCGSILSRVENVSLHQNVGTSFEALLFSYCIGTGELSPGVKRSELESVYSLVSNTGVNHGWSYTSAR